MGHVLIRNLDAGTIKRLKARARRSARSLQAELKLIIEGAVEANAEGIFRAADRARRRLRGKVFPDSTPLIREFRDR
jgi:plasmid stability protein